MLWEVFFASKELVGQDETSVVIQTAVAVQVGGG